jgi:LuxR family maltose regulon positive regulatory protein
MELPCSENAAIINLVTPVGFGKTSLAAAYGGSVFRHCVWFSLLEEDSAGLNLMEAISRSCEEAGVDAETWSDPLCLVLDNLHYASRELVPIIQKLFNSLPPGSAMVLCSDEDHCVPLSSLRIEQRVLELRSSDLAASREEADSFFRRAGSPVEPDALSIILKKTGGWWACLRLFALSWQKISGPEQADFLSGFRATDRFVAEFLSEMIDERLSVKKHDFLCTISICSAVSYKLAERLCTPDIDGLDEMFRSLEKMNFLLPMGRGWFRLPVMLRQYYYAALGRERRRTLHLTASQWFEKKGFPRQASYHLRKSRPSEQNPVSPLAKREAEILSLAGNGLSNAEIAERLFISTGTVKWHMNNILEKLDCPNRTAAAELAKRKGFLSSLLP